MKELPIEFEGKGEVKGFRFTQIAKNDFAYIYKVVTDYNTIHFEVFKKKINERYGVISYPSSKSFGLWAWTVKSYEEAVSKYQKLGFLNGELRTIYSRVV